MIRSVVLFVVVFIGISSALNNLFKPAAKGGAVKGKKVVVLGGNGFVGSRISQTLAESGNRVVAISRSGTIPSWCKDYDFVNNVEWVSADVNDAVALQKVLKGASSVISAIGAIGFDEDRLIEGNGKANVAAIEASKKSGVPKFVYVSVASQVKDTLGDKVLKPYFVGKDMAESALQKNYPGSKGTIVGPSFIYGGDSFTLTPPRVPGGYGSFIANLLSSPAIRKLAEVSPAPIALVLAPPVSVESVAAASSASALGKTNAAIIDGTDEIIGAAELLE